MSFFDFILGKPLRSIDEGSEQIGPIAGIPIFGLDALSSAAYGPEAALTLLIPLGLLGIEHIVPITAAIIVLLIIVFFSYLQTIDAYPQGGGSFTVASENLGDYAGLLAAAALMIDYILNAAVGISAGVGAVVSAFPQLQPHTLALCLAILALLTLINMRGVKDSGLAFLAPTYLFVGSLLLLIGVGAFRIMVSHGHPHAVVAPLAAAEGLCKRMHGHDRGGGGFEWSAGVQGADPEEREDYPYDHHRAADRFPGRDCDFVPGVPDRRD
jgi:amino acid transporter